MRLSLIYNFRKKIFFSLLLFLIVFPSLGIHLNHSHHLGHSNSHTEKNLLTIHDNDNDCFICKFVRSFHVVVNDGVLQYIQTSIHIVYLDFQVPIIFNLYFYFSRAPPSNF